MDTTTSVSDGDTEVSQPTTEAVAAEETQATGDQATSSQASGQDEGQSAEDIEADKTAKTDESQADDVTEWAKKKGISLDDPVKLAQMYRDAEKKMHEASQKAKELETAASQVQPLEYTGDQNYDNLAAEINQFKIQNAVRGFFETNPEAREFESKMAEIVVQRPHLQNDLDALYALARNAPDREAELKQAGGREALTNLAQKQQAVPPTANATNAGDFSSSKITPDNVDQLVSQNDRSWYEANRGEILRAAGMSR